VLFSSRAYREEKRLNDYYDTGDEEGTRRNKLLLTNYLFNILIKKSQTRTLHEFLVYACNINKNKHLTAAK
jgi:hypothetical protein